MGSATQPQTNQVKLSNVVKNVLTIDTNNLVKKTNYEEKIMEFKIKLVLIMIMINILLLKSLIN